MDMTMEKCETCKFFHLFGVQNIDRSGARVERIPDKRGQCKRMPPNSIIGGPARFPIVASEDWCGEYVGRAG